MPDPEELDALWGRAVARYPELGRKWGTAGYPGRSREPIQAYLALLRGESSAPTAATETGLAVRPPDYWSAEQWKQRGGDIAEGLVSLGKTINPITALPHTRSRIKRAGEALEALPEEAPWWQRGLASFTGAMEPELGALQAAQEVMSPLTGALLTVPGISEPEVRERYGYFRDQGHDPVSAMSAAYQQTVEAGEIPLWKSLPAEFVTDPLELLPGGIIAGGVKAGVRGARAGARAAKATKAAPKALDVPKEVPPPVTPADPVVEMQKALPLQMPFSEGPTARWEEAIGVGDIPARELAQRQAAEAADVAQEVGRREEVIARERETLGSIWTGRTPQKTTFELIPEPGQAPSVSIATPVIEDDVGRIWVGAIPKGGKEAIDRMTPTRRAQYGRWANIGDQIIGREPTLVDRPMHPVDSFITDDIRNGWRAEEAAGRNNPLSILVEYSQRGLDNIPAFKSARSKYMNTMSRQIFGNASRDNVTKIEDYINWIGNPEDSIFKWEQKEMPFGDFGQQLDLAMGDPKMRASLSETYYKPDPETGELKLIADRPPSPAHRGTPSVAEASATTAKGHQDFPTIGDAWGRADDDRLRVNLISKWVKDSNWGVFQLPIIDEARKALNSMATPDELGDVWKPFKQPFLTAARRIGGITRLNERFLMRFKAEGTEELERLGWLDNAGLATEEALGTIEAPGPLRILFYALHGPGKRGPTGNTWLQELSSLGVDAERQYWNLRKLTDWEEAFRMRTDMIKTGREDYFYRGWFYDDGEWGAISQRIDGARKRGKSQVELARNDFTFQEMEAFGFRPLFWNPYDMAITSSNMGMQQRLQIELLRILKQPELKMAEMHVHTRGTDQQAAEYNLRVQEGWRPVMNAGPTFKGIHFSGKPHKFRNVDPGTWGVDVNAQQATDLVWLFPDEIATRIEQMFAPTSGLENFMKKQRKIGNHTIGKLDDLIFIPKRVKLFASLFQQVDFFSRAGIGGSLAGLHSLYDGMRLVGKGNVDEGFREMAGARFHVGMIGKSWVDMAKANVSPGFRKTLAARQMDTTPWYLPEKLVGNKKGIDEWKKANPEEAKYTWTNLFANGLSTGDVTIFGADDAIKMLEDVAKETGVWKARAKKAPDFVRRLESAFRAGLFEGVYPAAIMADVRYNIIPVLKKMHPDLNSDQLMGLAAKEANKKWSTIPIEQSVFQGNARSILTRGLFSLGEFESMSRQITGVFRGPNKAFWAFHWAGAFVFFAMVANMIHFVTTSLTKKKEDGSWTIDPGIGELLPTDRHVPYIAKGWHTLGYGFKSKFLSPDIPIPTRSGDMAMLDLLNQFDYIFRMTDGSKDMPVWQFFDQRTGTLPRAILSQQSGKDWMGRDIDKYGWSQKGLQFLYDTLAPIGAGQLAVATTRNMLKNKELPHLELRITDEPLVTIIGKGANVERITPSVESRLGQDGHGILGPIDTGILLQALGLNLKGVSNDDIKDQMVRTTFGKGDHPDHEGLVLTSWKELQEHKDSMILRSIPFRDSRNARQVKEIEERRAEGAEFWYDEFGQMTNDITQSRKKRQEAEAKIVEKFWGTVNPDEAGPVTPNYEGKKAWSPSGFRAALKTANRDHRKRKETIEAIYGTDPNVLAIMERYKEEPSRSSESLEWAIWKFGTMRKDYADPISGDVDYKLILNGMTLNQAWEAETAGWDDEEEAETGGLLDRFDMYFDQGDHHPFVDKYYDALTVLKQAGYWQDGPKVQGDDYHRQLSALAVQQGMPYSDALKIWDNFLSASPEERRRLRSHPSSWATRQVVRNMEIVRKAHRFKTVMKNPILDRLLIKWYGNTPHLHENGRYYFELYGKMPSSYRKNPYT
jgi:hypothetical protein